MASMSSSPLAVESWSLFALGIVVVASRIIFRLCTLGSFAKLQCDDWLMIFVLVPFTGSIACANQAYNYWSHSDTEHDIFSLKMRFALEEFHLITTWTVKACLLILYWRIFIGSPGHRQILAYLSILCFMAFSLTQTLLPLWCRPTSSYWDPTSSSSQCNTYRNHTILSLITTVLTTLPTKMYPIPYIPIPRKPLLALLLLLGVVILITSLASRACLLANPASPVYMYFYIAESSLAILFANLPFLSSLVNAGSRERRRTIGGGGLGRVEWGQWGWQWPKEGLGGWTAVSEIPRKQQEREGSETTVSTAMEVPLSPIESRDGLRDLEKEDVVAMPPTPPASAKIVTRGRGSGEFELLGCSDGGVLVRSASAVEGKESGWPLP